MTSNSRFNDVNNHSNSKEFEVDFYQETAALPRYRSMPRSFLSALLDSPADNGSSGDESEALFSAIWSGPLDLNHKGGDDGSQIQITKQEAGAESEIRSGFWNGLSGYETTGAVSGGSGLECQFQLRSHGGSASNSNLVRQNSSPAGFFNAGCSGVMGDIGNYAAYRANSSAADASSSHLNFSGPSLSSRIVSNNRGIGNEHSTRNVEPTLGFSHDSWSETLKRSHDANQKMLNELHTPTPSKLIHQLSLPTTSNEKGEAERMRYLQFQPDVVPCQIRAKRGCATHPRSIAERMRRTRISERMKKLQELFPNMDKQTSTADMLELAVEHIKDLQTQLQTLTDAKAKCICMCTHSREN